METVDNDVHQLFDRFHKMQIKRKEKWVGTNTQRGREYGRTLAEPLEVEKIEAFESEHKLRLPEDFCYYITNFTKELLTYAYPTIIDLQVSPSFDQSTLSDDEFAFDAQINGELLENCSILIGVGGCAFEDVMIVKGNRSGSIWEYTDPVYYLSAESFTDLAKFQVTQYERDPTYINDDLLNDRSPMAGESYRKHNKYLDELMKPIFDNAKKRQLPRLLCSKKEPAQWRPNKQESSGGANFC